MAFEPDIDYVACLAAAAAYFAVGFVWYTPLFGKMWQKEMGLDAGVKPPAGALAKGLVISAVGAVLLTLVLFHVMAAFGAAEVASDGSSTAAEVNAGIEGVTMGMALEGAVWSWLGFFLPVDAGRVAWEGGSWKLVAINTGYHLVGLAVVSLVIAAIA